MTADKPIDRFLIAAVTDRLIYDSETVFDPEDARVLLDALPHRRSPRWGVGIAGKLPGGSTQGYAAGHGTTKIKDKKDRSFSYSTDADVYTRAGQWKLLWWRNRRGQFVSIDQVMADAMDEGRGARIRYSDDGTPTAMDIRVARTFRLVNIHLVIPGWKPWKVPAGQPG